MTAAKPLPLKMDLPPAHDSLLEFVGASGESRLKITRPFWRERFPVVANYLKNDFIYCPFFQGQRQFQFKYLIFLFKLL